MILLQGVWFLFNICLHCNISISHDEHPVDAFGQSVTTTQFSFHLQEDKHVRCRNLAKHILMEKCIENGEFTDGTLCKGITVGFYAPHADLFSIF